MTTKADQAAADRLLKAAVKRACEVIADASVSELRAWDGTTVGHHRNYNRAAVVAMLTAAGESADLLLGEAS